MSFLSSFFNVKEKLNEVDSEGFLIEIDESLRHELQHELTIMLSDIYEICKKYNIKMFLLGGSALGAVRHKGFIPWDDDIDISMTRKDYNRFVKIFNKELGKKYILCAPNVYKNPKARFPKILKKNSYMEEICDSRNKKLCRVFVDIFILENIPENRVLRKLHGNLCNCLEVISGCVSFRTNADKTARDFYKKAGLAQYYLRITAGTLFAFLPERVWFNLVDKCCNYKKESNWVAIPTGRKHYFGEILEKDKLFPLVEMEFEGKKFPVFSGYDYYLKNLYGDYMKIPPVEKREKHFVKKLRLEKH